MEVDEASGPIDVGLLGPIRVVPSPDRLTESIEEAHAANWRGYLDGQADWTDPAADAMICDRRARLVGRLHARIFRPHMQHVAHSAEGVLRGGFGRKAPVSKAPSWLHIRLHSSESRVQSI